MGFLDWLFGRQARQANAIVWRLSDQGNSTAIVGKDRITAFPQDDRRSYCVVDVDDRREPYSLSPMPTWKPPAKRCLHMSARRVDEQKALYGCRRGLGQQDGADRVRADDDRRSLKDVSCCLAQNASNDRDGEVPMV